MHFPSIYDIVPCQPVRVNWKNYATVSSEGVTHFQVDSVEFTPLGDYLWERRNFRTIASLRTFREFRKRKYLALWRSAVFKLYIACGIGRASLGVASSTAMQCSHASAARLGGRRHTRGRASAARALTLVE